MLPSSKNAKQVNFVAVGFTHETSHQDESEETIFFLPSDGRQKLLHIIIMGEKIV